MVAGAMSAIKEGLGSASPVTSSPGQKGDPPTAYFHGVILRLTSLLQSRKRLARLLEDVFTL